MAARFRVGLTREILHSSGEPAFGQAALKILDDVPAMTRAGILVTNTSARSCCGWRACST